jgi:hypothetical protein
LIFLGVAVRGSSWFDKSDDAIFTVSGSTVNALLVVLMTALLVESAYPGALMGPLNAFVNPSPRYQQAQSAVRETVSIPETRTSASFAELWNDVARPDWPNWAGYKRVELIAPLKSPPPTQIAAAPPTQVAAKSPPKRVNPPRQQRPVVLARPNTPPYPPSGYGAAPGGTGFGFGFR